MAKNKQSSQHNLYVFLSKPLEIWANQYNPFLSKPSDDYLHDKEYYGTVADCLKSSERPESTSKYDVGQV